MFSRSILIGFILSSTIVLAAVDFNRDVRPILASKCYACHGPDEESRKAKLRLDVREQALKKEAFVPGKIKESELHYRIHSDDPDEIMPPPNSHEPMSAEEKAILDQWIQEGAEYDKHWSFEPPIAKKPPELESWGHNPIDSFVFRSMQSQDLQPSKEADPYTLVRRLYLDLIGLPPTPEQADTFVKDSDENAYERLVDQLLKSPHYGEKWARSWLDLARYADTNGYEKDRARTIWPFRDWVIKALNDDMPFDQFTIEQLAGDMLPNATQSQITATGFHRNTMLNEEEALTLWSFDITRPWIGWPLLERFGWV